MKLEVSADDVNQLFLSDLCGREDKLPFSWVKLHFLSDLCGREVGEVPGLGEVPFLSDLCGREENEQPDLLKKLFSKRPVRS